MIKVIFESNMYGSLRTWIIGSQRYMDIQDLLDIIETDLTVKDIVNYHKTLLHDGEYLISLHEVIASKLCGNEYAGLEEFSDWLMSIVRMKLHEIDDLLELGMEEDEVTINVEEWLYRQYDKMINLNTKLERKLINTSASLISNARELSDLKMFDAINTILSTEIYSYQKNSDIILASFYKRYGDAFLLHMTEEEFCPNSWAIDYICKHLNMTKELYIITIVGLDHVISDNCLEHLLYL